MIAWRAMRRVVYCAVHIGAGVNVIPYIIEDSSLSFCSQ